MNRKIITTITEKQHNLVGLGNITYTYTRNGKPTMRINIENGGRDILCINEKAEKIFREIDIEIDNDIEVVKNIAAHSCGIQLFRIYERSRQTDIIFARYCIFWYLKNIKLKGVSNIGNMFNMNHATIIYGLKMFDMDDKFMSKEHRRYKSIFLGKLKERKLL